MPVKKQSLKPVVAAMGAAIAVSLGPTSVEAAGNPFSMTDLSSGYGQLAQRDGRCGTGKCGGSRPSSRLIDGKCGTGKCAGTQPAAVDGKCGAGKCGGAKSAAAAGKCGTGKCAGAKLKARANAGKCGTGKCGAGR